MDLEQLTDIITKREIFIDNPLFYNLSFTYACQQRKLSYSRDDPSNLKAICNEEYNTLSLFLDRSQLQESCQIRNVLKTRRLANLLIDEKGDFQSDLNVKLISEIEKQLYSLGPNRQYEAKREEHILTILRSFIQNKELINTLKNITVPLSHPYLNEIILDTLQLPLNTPITNAHTRRAVLSSLLCTLRQNVGSCFATAPAIIIHDEKPELFLKDINELFSFGCLKRTFGGTQYSVPLSHSFGSGDLKKPFVIDIESSLISNDIAFSPGLLKAFEASLLIDLKETLELRLEGVKRLILTFLNSIEKKSSFIIITPEQLIRSIILQQLKLSEKDLILFQNRPKTLIFNELLIKQSTSSQAQANLENLYLNFLVKFNAATKAFKSLADNALLKAWEFSLASFAETKTQFTRWNLYESLGFNIKEPFGIGYCIYNQVHQHLEEANRLIQERQQEYEYLFIQIKTLETRINSASSEKEAQWIRAEYQSKRNEFFSLEEIRDKAQNKARIYANLYNILIERYDELFPLYFQEVYDADMLDISADQYNDSPAGFRLLYKHGRSHSAVWTRIETPADFIESLTSFFSATEFEITSDDEFASIKNEIVEITTAIVSHIRTKEFLESALNRMSLAHKGVIIKNPLENLDKIEKKPWAYTSGGNMSTLVSCYYKLDNPPKEVTRWVESPTELFVFLVDTLKHLSQKQLEPYIKNSQKSMLIHSPTHAFLLKPGALLFKQAWMSEAFTYTWIRDTYINTRKQMIQKIWLNETNMQFLVKKLSLTLPQKNQTHFLQLFDSFYEPLSPKEFKAHVMQKISKEKSLQYSGQSILNGESIDSLLYSLLPLSQKNELKENLEKIYTLIPEITLEERTKLVAVYDIVSSRLSNETIIDANTLQEIAKGLLCLTFAKTTTSINFHLLVATAAQNLKLALPAPILIADTNWIKEDFLFVVNPGTENLELWRGDYTGRVGFPMSNWNQWLNGSRKDILWGVYTDNLLE